MLFPPLPASVLDSPFPDAVLLWHTSLHVSSGIPPRGPAPRPDRFRVAFPSQPPSLGGLGNHSRLLLALIKLASDTPADTETLSAEPEVTNRPRSDHPLVTLVAPSWWMIGPQRSAWADVVIKSLRLETPTPTPHTPPIFSFFAQWDRLAPACCLWCVCVFPNFRYSYSLNRFRGRGTFSKMY